MKPIGFPLAAFAFAGLLGSIEPAEGRTHRCRAESYAGRSLAAGGEPMPAAAIPRGVKRVLRFVQLSDVHLLDDDASPLVAGQFAEYALEPTIGNSSAQRFQDEYTDEVLNAMERTVDRCHAELRGGIDLTITTGDTVDQMLVNETRRFIDNMDGVSGADTAFEFHCGYLTEDSRGMPKLGVPACTPELRSAVVSATGKLVSDAQSKPPSPDDPLDQFSGTRILTQMIDVMSSSIAGGSLLVAPGLPPVLRCRSDKPGCANNTLDVPYYVVFGNHDGAVRGTFTRAPVFSGPALLHGRHEFESQRGFVNEFFFTAPLPGPLGHGFNHVDGALDNSPSDLDGALDRWNDPDDRNDGYYAFDAGAGGRVRMIVLNTLYDGVRTQIGPGGPVLDLHQNGQTNAGTQGLASGNEVTGQIGLESGVLDDAQYRWLERQLTTAAERPILVFSHHPDRSFSEHRLGFPADGGRTAAELNELLGRFPNVVAHVAGHTHENVIRPCAPGAENCAIGAGGSAPNVGHGFWRIETASLIDYPQEGRIIEVFDRCPGPACGSSQDDRYLLRLTMIAPDPEDAIANRSHELSIAEAKCTLKDILGGPLTTGPHDAARVETIVTNAGEAAVRQKFCFGEASLRMAEGEPGDRDVVLFP